jgi:cAMP-dependent protein kinase regulator
MQLPFSRPKIENLDQYLARKEYDKALTAVVDELKRNPNQFNLLLRKAEILGLAGDAEHAIEVYRELAKVYTRDGFYAKAIALYKKVLRLDPSLEDVHSELAVLIEEDKRSSLPLAERLRQSQASAEKETSHDTETSEAEPPDRVSASQQLKELEASALFASFPREALEEVLSSTSLRTYEEGDIIVTEGEQGSSLFLIVSGHVKVFTRGDSGEHIRLAELGPGDFFGEVSLLTGKPRTATITARDHVLAIELTRSAIDSIAERHPEVLGVLEEFYEQRAQDTVETMIRRMREQE